jgi:hypothetical protein
MERSLIILFVVLLIFAPFVKAEEQTSTQPSMTALITPQNVDFKNCTRTYIMPAEKLFYMAIASAKENKFTVDEIQSKTGYILFTAVGKQYLASVVKVDSTHTQLKITPTNNNYFFAPGIVSNFFRYIDLNGATPLVELGK